MQCSPPSVFTIFLGDVKVMHLKAAYSETGDPLDLTSCTEIVVSLPNADGSTAQLKLTLGQVAVTSPANLGKFTANISAIVSALLNVATLQNFDVAFTINGATFTVRYYSALTVFQNP